jgi:hypothetical protein
MSTAPGNLSGAVFSVAKAWPAAQREASQENWRVLAIVVASPLQDDRQMNCYCVFTGNRYQDKRPLVFMLNNSREVLGLYRKREGARGIPEHGVFARFRYNGLKEAGRDCGGRGRYANSIVGRSGVELCRGCAGGRDTWP